MVAISEDNFCTCEAESCSEIKDIRHPDRVLYQVLAAGMFAYYVVARRTPIGCRLKKGCDLVLAPNGFGAQSDR